MVIVFIWKNGVVVDSYDVSGRTVDEALIAVKDIVESELPPDVPKEAYSYSYSEKP